MLTNIFTSKIEGRRRKEKGRRKKKKKETRRKNLMPNAEKIFFSITITKKNCKSRVRGAIQGQEAYKMLNGQNSEKKLFIPCYD